MGQRLVLQFEGIYRDVYLYKGAHIYVNPYGLRVNGRTVKLRGACIYHDAGLLGACAYDDYEYRRVLRLKEAGFNAVRSAHNPASQALLRACDRLGMYVMDELVDVWNKSKVSYDYAVDFERCWESDIRHLTHKNRVASNPYPVLQ